MSKTQKCYISKEEYERIVKSIDQQYEQVRDIYDRRWVKCKHCGDVLPVSECWQYGGQGTINVGECYTCEFIKRKEEF